MTNWVVSDGNAVTTLDSWKDILHEVETWYDYLVDQDVMDSIPDISGLDEIKEGDLPALLEEIALWEEEIAKWAGEGAFFGHMDYMVSAADQLGLHLSVKEEE